MSAAPDLTTAVVAVEPPAAAPAEVRDPLERAARTQRNQPPPVIAAPSAAKPPSKPPAKAPSGKPKKSKPAMPAPKTPPVATSGNLAVVVTFALSQAGKPYRWGSTGPYAYDCSGLLVASFARIGIRLPHQSGAIARLGRQVPRSQIRAGDTLHWPGHTALALGGNQMVHASRPGVPVKVAAIYGNPRVIRIVG